jgi:hypothetical protein
VIGGPLAWILGSPLFIRTELVEAAPAGQGTTAVASPAIEPNPSAVASPASSAGVSPKPSQSPTPFPARSVAMGRFRGADDFHYGSGLARIIETEPGSYVLRVEEFSVRNGPDLFVYLSPARDGYERGALELGRLKATDGSFNYRIPAGTDVTEFRSAVVWCKAFSVQFAHAPLG